MDIEGKNNAQRWRRILYVLLSVGITVGIMGYLLGKNPLKVILRAVLDMDRRAVFCFMVLSFGQVFFRTWRYQMLLRNIGERVGNIAMLLTTLIRNLFSDLLPARIGTLSYIWVMTQRLGVPLQSAASSFALAFLFDMIVMAPLLLIALLLVGNAAGLPGVLLSIVAVAMLVLLIVVLGYLPRLLDLAGRLLGKFKRPTFKYLEERLKEAAEQVRQTRGAGLYCRILVLSLLVRICKYGALYFLFYAIARPYGYELANLPVSLVFIGISAAELAASTPISGIAGFGAYEGAWALTFGLLGFTEKVAGVTAVAGHMLTQMWGYGLGAGALLLILLPVFGKKLKERQIVSKKREGLLRFGVGVAVSMVVIALGVFALLKSETSSKTAGADADTATPREREARKEIAEELTGLVLFDSNRSGTFGIWVMNPDGSDLRPVVDTKFHEMYPSASPDGQWIAYARYERLARKAPSGIWLVRLDGTGGYRLIDDGTFPSWSRDGKKIFFERDRAKLMVVDSEGGEPVEILPEKAPEMGKYELVKPRVSPDGAWAAFITDRKGRWNVWIVDLDTGRTIRVGKGCEPAWLPDSKSLVWIASNPPDTSLRRYELSSGERSDIRDAGTPHAMEYFPSVSPDGGYLFYGAAPGVGQADHYTANYQIYVKPLDGRPPVRLTFDAYTNRWPSHIPSDK